MAHFAEVEKNKEGYKICKDCKNEKPLSEYHKNKNRDDGVTIVCKPCAIERSRKWQQSHKERVNEVCRKNYALKLEESRMKRRKRVKEWVKRNIDRERIITREYFKLHPERKRFSEQRRRFIKKGNGIYVILPKEERRLLKSACIQCGTTVGITLDHIIPISKGGRHSIGNLQPLCRPCNSSKGSKTMIEWRCVA